ncbi:MAG: DUF308 domain-containing protein [Pseudomonadota bacterium]
MTAHAFRVIHIRENLLDGLLEKWPSILLRGLAAIIFGSIAFAWPGLTILGFIFVLAAYTLVDAAAALHVAFRARRRLQWWLIAIGIADLVIGAVALLWPSGVAGMIFLFSGVWIAAHGAFEILGAMRLRHEIDSLLALLAAGMLSLLFGVFVLVAPDYGALALIWLIGVYAFAYGVLLIGLALHLRHAQSVL